MIILTPIERETLQVFFKESPRRAAVVYRYEAAV
jgi:hypothetical protein